MSTEHGSSDTGLRALIATVRKGIRALDSGHHYCRYCSAKSPEWSHGPYCPYVESQRDVEAAKHALAELEALVEREAASQTPECEWTPREGGTWYETACGRTFAPDGDLDGFRFCYACGKHLRVAAPRPESGESR